MPSKQLYVHTIGCQMNLYDSEKIAAVLNPLGYAEATTAHSADLIIVNTCAIRAKAEQKAFSYLGRLAELKRRKPRLIIGVGGCLAQQQGAKIMGRIPAVDLVFGTHAIERLPVHVQTIEQERYRITDVALSTEFIEMGADAHVDGNGRISCFVTIMQGCDNYCAYCVVPYVRGPEISRKPEQILQEIQTLVDNGLREVTLLGQNVNSYGTKQQFCSFAQLLHRINAIDGLLRIRFTTSHPKDLSDELIQAFAEMPKLCRHIHLPVQSGSNAILKQMNRKYTREDYLSKVKRLRAACPDIAITSDFIVGFPGESQKDFEDSLNLIKQVEYDSLFAFKYSDRPEAPAAHYSRKRSESVKQSRLERLLRMQRAITLQKNRALIGTDQQVLVEGYSKRQSSAIMASAHHKVQWTGRTTTNKIVNFYDDPDLNITAGRLVNVCIAEAFANSLWGWSCDRLKRRQANDA